MLLFLWAFQENYPFLVWRVELLLLLDLCWGISNGINAFLNNAEYNLSSRKSFLFIGNNSRFVKLLSHLTTRIIYCLLSDLTLALQNYADSDSLQQISKKVFQLNLLHNCTISLFLLKLDSAAQFFSIYAYEHLKLVVRYE